MKKLPLRILVVLLVIPFCFHSVAADHASPAAFQLDDDEISRVVIRLDLPENLKLTPAERSQRIGLIQETALEDIRGPGFQLIHRYRSIPYLSAEIDRSALLRLQRAALVHSITPDAAITAFDPESLPAVEADIVQEDYGLSGAGVTVAVLDTGIDLDNPDFAGRITATQCFTHGDCQPGDVNQSLDAEDQNGHGTNVAGIIASSGAASPDTRGFAPQAKLVAVRVLDHTGIGYLSDWVAAMDWIYDHLSSTPVDIVNMSLGTYALYGANCDAVYPEAAAMVNLLHQAGITVFASSGNAGSGTGIAAPACLSHVVAVGATYDSSMGRVPSIGTYSDFLNGFPACYDSASSINTITCFSNSSSMLDLLAPGVWIKSSAIGGGVSTFAGTSQASPAAAGAAALLLDQNPALLPDEIEDTLKDTGVNVTDPKNGLNFPRINVREAVLSQTRVAVLGAPAGTINQDYTFSAVTMPHDESIPVTYLWQSPGFADLTTATATYNFDSTGEKTITLTVTSAYGSFSASRSFMVFSVEPEFVHLPTVMR